MTPVAGMSQPPVNFEVELPGGGKLHLQTIEEVDLWEESRDRYLDDYRISQQSDRLAVGNLLLLHLESFRASQRMNGMEPRLDANGVPTGQYQKVTVKGADRTAALNVILKSQEAIRDIEKSLGIDKKTRDQGGQYDVSTYVGVLKNAGKSYALHLSRRYKRYEATIMEARMKLRMLENLDQEDLQEAQLSPTSFIDWMRGELTALEEADRKYAHEKGKLFIGKLR